MLRRGEGAVKEYMLRRGEGAVKEYILRRGEGAIKEYTYAEELWKANTERRCKYVC